VKTASALGVEMPTTLAAPHWLAQRVCPSARPATVLQFDHTSCRPGVDYPRVMAKSRQIGTRFRYCRLSPSL